MKNVALITIHIWAAASLCWIAACSSNTANKKLEGEWLATDGSKLHITTKKFAMGEDEEEDYFVKGDTIYTSFEGNLPYTKFALKGVDDHTLKIVGPDSVAMEYNK